ncbi:hypothetical protein ACFC3O_00585 [Streptomyces sp. NPDC056007]|uniref:hypothetical protein n=1 Tax=Streptomyces sp. NPDC056007 TaxID=3345678 RepID=UPI0035E343C9
MTTTPKGTHMPTDPNRALLRAVGSLTTQVRRIADSLADGTAQDSFALAPPVATDDDGAQTTPDDTPTTSGAQKQRTIRRQQFRLLLNQLNAGVTPLTTAQVQALTAYVADEIVECNMETKEADRLEAELAQVRAELDRIYTRRAPGGEGYVSLTVDEQAVMGEELARIRRALDPDDETYIRETVDDQLAMTATLNRVRAVRDQWALNTLEPGQVRRLLDDLTAAIDNNTKEN